MLFLFILIPLLFVVMFNLPAKGQAYKVSFWLSLLVCFSQVLVAVLRPAFLWNNNSPAALPFFNFNLSSDPLSLIMFLTIGLAAFFALIVGYNTIKDKKSVFNFINLLLLSLVGMNGIVLASDIFTLYVFLEITSVCSFILIALNNDKFALEGAFKYIMLSAVATVLMLSSIALILILYGSTSFLVIKASLHNANPHFLVVLSVILFVCGLFIKGGLVPFHGWLADAYSAAPAGVSVLLAGIVTKASGIYTLIRILVFVFDYSANTKAIVMFVGAVSIVLGALLSLRQTDFKRMLAYSSISQIGYIVLSAGCGSALGIAAAAFHLFNHTVLKSLLFTNSAAVESQLNSTEMNRMGGLSIKMPVTGFTSVVGFLSVAGIPPLSGFWSKLLIVVALWAAGQYIYAVIAVLASVLTLAYFLALQRKVFFGKLAAGLENTSEAGAGIVFSEIALAVITVAAGVFFPWVMVNFIFPVQNLLR
ncbi:MAG: proton-conducting transporter membrane subunit [Candidatus Omnitrophica bacterium]|nr:proton-conducting transporter membrane subunit [Candidatus Omnitrophota bacterium]